MSSIYQKLGTATVITGIMLSTSLWCNRSAQAMALRNLPNLQSITFFERTGGSTSSPFTFAVNSSQLLNQIAILNSNSNDFNGTRTEFYDVFYSDASGNFDPGGEFVTIEGVFGIGSPAGGGLNIAGTRLNFNGGLTEFANRVVNFTALGNNAIPSDVTNAVDGNLRTHTTMGNTIDQTEKLSLTLGFASNQTSTPEPSTTLGLLTLGFISAGTLLRHRQKTNKN